MQKKRTDEEGNDKAHSFSMFQDCFRTKSEY